MRTTAETTSLQSAHSRCESLHSEKLSDGVAIATLEPETSGCRLGSGSGCAMSDGSLVIKLIATAVSLTHEIVRNGHIQSPLVQRFHQTDKHQTDSLQ
jgi:hypothetical protein